jgi:hypothetical protein
MKFFSNPQKDSIGSDTFTRDVQANSLTSVITFDPFYNVDADEYSHSDDIQRDLYIKSQFIEAERVIATLRKIFGGVIVDLRIERFDVSVPCVLQVARKLTDTDRANIQSISRNLQIS